MLADYLLAYEESINTTKEEEARDVLLNEMDKVEAELARLREAARWIPVGERLPEDYETVLVTNDGNRITQGFYSEKRGLWTAYIGGFRLDVTHWRPLPEPPEVE